MILADTSIWVDHLNASEALVEQLTDSGDLVIHPFVIGELAMGSLRNRGAIIATLNKLNMLLPVRHSEVMKLIEQQMLYGAGLQYIDVHLLASALITDGCLLWTRDKRLLAAAERLGVAA
jgi:predicted nucleic acid-binding protein